MNRTIKIRGHDPGTHQPHTIKILSDDLPMAYYFTINSVGDPPSSRLFVRGSDGEGRTHHFVEERPGLFRQSHCDLPLSCPWYPLEMEDESWWYW